MHDRIAFQVQWVFLDLPDYVLSLLYFESFVAQASGLMGFLSRLRH